MTMTAQTFHLGTILTVTTGRLLTPSETVREVYEILNYLTGDSVYTHQIPRVMNECRPHLIRQLPWLEAITEEQFSPETSRAAVARLVATHGAMHAVQPIPRDDHEVRDPVEELRTMRPDATILVIDPADLQEP